MPETIMGVSFFDPRHNMSRLIECDCRADAEELAGELNHQGYRNVVVLTDLHASDFNLNRIEYLAKASVLHDVVLPVGLIVGFLVFVAYVLAKLTGVW